MADPVDTGGVLVANAYYRQPTTTLYGTPFYDDVELAFAHAYHNHQPGAGATRHWAAFSIPVAVVLMVWGVIQEYRQQARVEHAHWEAVLANPPLFCDGTRPSALLDLLKHSLNSQHQQQCDELYLARTLGPNSPNIIDVVATLTSRTVVSPFRALVHVLGAATWVLQLVMVLSFTAVFLYIASNKVGAWRRAMFPALPWSGTPRQRRHWGVKRPF